MASVAEILFGDKKNKHLSRPQHSKSEQRKQAVPQKPPMLSQERISQLLGKTKPSSKSKPTTIEKNRSTTSVKKENPTHYSPIEYKSYRASEHKTNTNTSLLNQITPTSKKIAYVASKEDKLIKNLKNFMNIDDLLEDLEKNKEYSKIFPQNYENETKIVQDRDETRLKSGQYKPTTSSEAQLFKNIDEANRLKQIDDFKMIGKKQKSEVRSNNSKGLYYTEDEIWCSKCKTMHGPDLHKKIVPVQVDYRKIFQLGNVTNAKKIESSNNSTVNNAKPVYKNVNSLPVNNRMPSSKIEINNKVKEVSYNKISSVNNVNNTKSNSCKATDTITNNNKNVQGQTVKPISSIEEKIQQLKLMTKQEVKRNEERKQPANNKYDYQVPSAKKYTSSSYDKKKESRHKDALFSREDFEDEDDFIVQDEDESEEDYRRHMMKINRGLRRGGYYNSKYDEYSDGDLEEAGFDQIQAEEEKTARIGEHEDWIEEMKEKELMERKKRK